jgi:hypothetical protein
MGDSSDEDMAAYTQALSELLALRQRHVLIVDATKGKSLKGTHRNVVARWNKENAAALTKYRVGLVLVTPSALLRGMITAVYWIFPAPFPYKAVDTLDAAYRWAEANLVKRESA